MKSESRGYGGDLTESSLLQRIDERSPGANLPPAFDHKDNEKSAGAMLKRKKKDSRRLR